MRIIGPYNDPDIDYAQMARDVTNDALEVNKENKQLRKLLSECKEHIDFWMSAVPPSEEDYGKMEISIRELQKRIEEELK